MASENVAKNFEAENIVPELLELAPAAKVTVIYPGNKQVLFNELAPTDVKSQPEIMWDADPNQLYTLSMIDPDAPSRGRPIFGEVNHWLVVNIKGNDLSTGEILAPYAGSGPPKGSGLHRYIFLVFQQPGPVMVIERKLDTLRKRMNFSIKKFAKKYNLGNAIAGNFFKAQWDSSVPERRLLRILLWFLK